MFINIRDSARLKFIDNRVITAFHVVYGLTRRINATVIVTSGCDGQHGKRSYHPDGLGWDFIWLPWKDVKTIGKEIFLTLKSIDPYYDVVVKSTGKEQHLHIEYDIRRKAKHEANEPKGHIIKHKPFTKGVKEMGLSLGAILKFVASVLSPVLSLITARFRDEIVEFVKKKYAEAKETENPWDDFLFELLAKMFAIPLD